MDFVPIRIARTYATITALVAGADIDITGAAEWRAPADVVLRGVYFDAGVPPLSLVAAEVSLAALTRDAQQSIYGITFSTGLSVIPAPHARKRWNSTQGMLGVMFPDGCGVPLVSGTSLFLNYAARNYGGNWSEDGYVTAYLYWCFRHHLRALQEASRPIVLDHDLDRRDLDFSRRLDNEWRDSRGTREVDYRGNRNRWYQS